jgi:hypothetical protein
MVNNSFATPDIVIFEIKLMSMLSVRLGFSFSTEGRKSKANLRSVASIS